VIFYALYGLEELFARELLSRHSEALLASRSSGCPLRHVSVDLFIYTWCEVTDMRRLFYLLVLASMMTLAIGGIGTAQSTLNFSLVTPTQSLDESLPEN